AKGPQVAHWLREEAFSSAAEHRHENAGHHGHGHVDVNRHDDHIRAFCIYYDRPIHASGLVLWLNLLAGLRGANLLRVKGLLNVEGKPVVINAVQTLVHEPVTLGAWPGEDRRSRLVFITRDMERAEIERTLGAFELRAERREGAPAIDPEEYARFLAVAKNFR
ncbi:MAG: GTP-binding protein, partial [Betaproteobacteria bacterium]|nr:GTP-binding protein [Betaproteobacteria bacterium]